MKNVFKTKTPRLLAGFVVLLIAAMFVLAGCGGGGGDPGPGKMTYQGTVNGQTYKLEITEVTQGKAAYTPKPGDTYVLTVGDKISRGTVDNYASSTNEITLQPSDPEVEPFKASIGSDGLTGFTGSVTWEGETTPEPLPVEVTPIAPPPEDVGEDTDEYTLQWIAFETTYQYVYQTINSQGWDVTQGSNWALTTGDDASDAYDYSIQFAVDDSGTITGTLAECIGYSENGISAPAGLKNAVNANKANAPLAGIFDAEICAVMFYIEKTGGSPGPGEDDSNDFIGNWTGYSGGVEGLELTVEADTWSVNGMNGSYTLDTYAPNTARVYEDGVLIGSATCTDELLTVVLTDNPGQNIVFARQTGDGTAAEIEGTWQGTVLNATATVVVSKDGWTLTIPDLGYYATGTYTILTMKGDQASLKSMDGTPLGTANVTGTNTMTLSLYSNTDAPGNHTLTRYTGGSLP